MARGSIEVLLGDEGQQRNKSREENADRQCKYTNVAGSAEWEPRTEDGREEDDKKGSDVKDEEAWLVYVLFYKAYMQTSG